jgi:hypothetical protein
MLALEYIRKRLMSGHFFFPNTENPSPSHCKNMLAPFCFSKEKILLQQKRCRFDFEKWEGWIYEPHGVIVAINPTYNHQHNVLVERNTNLGYWEEVKKILLNETPNPNTSSSQDNRVQTTHPIKTSFLEI